MVFNHVIRQVNSFVVVNIVTRQIVTHVVVNYAKHQVNSRVVVNIVTRQIVPMGLSVT